MELGGRGGWRENGLVQDGDCVGFDKGNTRPLRVEVMVALCMIDSLSADESKRIR